MKPGTTGSLFSGIGGLDLVAEAFGFETRWQVENNPQASAVLRRWWPEVPNYGDITTVDWENVERVEMITAGFPCQDISYAGRGAGLSGERSGVWFEVVRALRILRPRIVFVENSSALVTRGLPDVVGSLAELGYISTWGSFRASSIGAPHRRERSYLIATDSDSLGRQGWAGAPGPGWRREPTHGGGTPTADSDSDRRERWQEQNGQTVRPELEAPRWNDAMRRSSHAYGEWEPAVRRWEGLTRTAPPATVGGRLNPDFSEWMMGFPEGWTSGHAKTHRIRLCGNAVVPQCAHAAFGALMETHMRLSASEPAA